MRLSVIVTSYRAPSVLARCLAALLAQPEPDEIVIADCSPEPPPVPRNPRVRLLHLAEPVTVPRLRWAALDRTSGDVVAAVEGRMIPSGAWARTLRDAHVAHPKTPAIGGPVTLDAGASLFDRGLYYAEYGRFALPLDAGPAHDLSGANLSFKRAALEANHDLLDAGHWETHLFTRWCEQGTPPRLVDAPVAFVNTMTWPTAFRQRFDYGRGYAAARPRRWFHAPLSPALPLVLTARQIAGAVHKARLSDLLPALLWTAALETAWSAGELAGYLAGPPRKDVIY